MSCHVGTYPVLGSAALSAAALSLSARLRLRIAIGSLLVFANAAFMRFVAACCSCANVALSAVPMLLPHRGALLRPENALHNISDVAIVRARVRRRRNRRGGPVVQIRKRRAAGVLWRRRRRLLCTGTRLRVVVPVRSTRHVGRLIRATVLDVAVILRGLHQIAAEALLLRVPGDATLVVLRRDPLPVLHRPSERVQIRQIA